MLHLIGYDLGTNQGRQSLKQTVEDLAGTPDLCHNVPSGPWLLKTRASVEKVLVEVDTEVAAAQRGLRPAPTRKLLALSLAEPGDAILGVAREASVRGQEEAGGLHNHTSFGSTVKWLEEVGFSLHDEGWYSPRVLVIVFALHGARAGDYRELHKAIWHRFHGCCNPLHTLWFVRTSLPPREVCHYLEPFLHDRDAKRMDELLVLHPKGPAVESGIERVRSDVGWLWENGIPVKHRWPPAPVAHKSAIHVVAGASSRMNLS